MRQIQRYGYSLRRFLHHSWIDFRVWRQNRQVSGAFRDPILEGPDTLSLLAKPFRTPWISMTAAGLAVAAVLWILKSDFGWSRLGGMQAGRANATWTNWGFGMDGKTALSDVPAAPAGSGVTDSMVPASDGVNRAIMLVAAGLEAETDPGPIHIPVPPKLPERYNALVACKLERTLYVYERKGKADWTRLAAFPMAFGRKDGDKADAGDRRTPEGRYWITSVLSGPAQGPLYGPLVFTLNYPTPRDLAEGKGGEGIWIHGVEAGKRPTFTRGCLSLANDDVMQLAKYADAGTPILILEESVPADPARQFDETGMEREYPALMAEHARRTGEDTLKLEKALAEARAYLQKEAREHPVPADEGLSHEDKEAILARLAKWREDWSNRDADAYALNYAAGFRDRQGRALGDFLERKRRIFASKTRISMEMDGPAIEPESGGKANVTFRQEYAAEGGEGIQRSSGSKTVWLERGPQGWLIVKE